MIRKFPLLASLLYKSLEYVELPNFFPLLSCALIPPRERGRGRIRTQSYNTSCLRPILNLRLYFYGRKNGTVRVLFRSSLLLEGGGVCIKRSLRIVQPLTHVFIMNLAE